MKVDRRFFLAAAASALAFPAEALAGPFRRRDNVYAPSKVADKPLNKSSVTAPTTYQITDVLTRNLPSEYQAYYKVETDSGAPFYITQRKESVNQRITGADYDKKDKTAGRLFPKSNDSTKPVAIVDAVGAGLNGLYHIYDEGNSYKVSFQLSPILDVPSHTEISSNYMLNIDQALKAVPAAGLIEALKNKSTKFMIGKNVDDTYYHLYPSWKTDDKNKVVDPSKPWIEKINGQWVDHRKHCHVPGMYSNNKIVMPQRYIKYPSDTEVENQGDLKDRLKSTTFHELGHALDYLKSTLYSDLEDFVTIYNEDKSKIPPEEEEKVAYFLKNRREPFAELVGALMGGLSTSRSERILGMFPNAAEYIRKNILPEYGYSVTEEEIREKIYPAYKLENNVAEKLALNIWDMRNEPFQYC